MHSMASVESAAPVGGGGFVAEAARALTRPGPPRGWAARAGLLVAGAGVASSLVIAWAGWATRGDPDRYFGEQRPGTLLSAGLLFASAEVCRRTHALPAAAAFGRFWPAHAA